MIASIGGQSNGESEMATTISKLRPCRSWDTRTTNIDTSSYHRNTALRLITEIQRSGLEKRSGRRGQFYRYVFNSMACHKLPSMSATDDAIYNQTLPREKRAERNSFDHSQGRVGMSFFGKYHAKIRPYRSPNRQAIETSLSNIVTSLSHYAFRV
jgi:hypothetical protein